MIDEDVDELSTDTIPCSPGAVLRYGDTTQPTQVLSRPTLGSSSPASVVEVPASSPFQPPKQRLPLGNRIAPAGTSFRPPPKPMPVRSIPAKRPAPEHVEVISDDDEDEDDTNQAQSRADIRPTTFKSQIQSFAYNAQADGDLKRKMRQVYDVFGPKVPSSRVRQALEQCDNKGCSIAS